MVISIHQPDYIPWLGFYYKMAPSDVFVYLDDAQFSNEAAHNYNLIKTCQGQTKLKIPVDYNFGDKLNNVTTRDNLKWKEKHLKTISYNYSKAPYFKSIYPCLTDVLLKTYPNIAEMNMEINKFICEGFGIKPKIYKSSELNIKTTKEARVIDICRLLGASEYLSGNGARVYQKPEHFLANGINLKYSDYQPIEYNQVWKDFIPSLSVLDFLFNMGFDWGYVENQTKEVNYGDR